MNRVLRHFGDVIGERECVKRGFHTRGDQFYARARLFSRLPLFRERHSRAAFRDFPLNIYASKCVHVGENGTSARQISKMRLRIKCLAEKIQVNPNNC